MAPSVILCVGLLLAWVGERIVESAASRAALTGVGTALVFGGLVWRAIRARDQQSGRAGVHRALLLLHGLALVALTLYALQSDLFTKLTDASLESSSPTLAGVFGALWPAVLLASLLPTLLIELSYAAMAKAPKLEDGRIREALYAGLALAFVLIFAASAQYVASERDVKADLSYFRVAKASEATQKLVASFDEPVEVYLFYPPASDSAALVTTYFEALTEAAPVMLKLTRLDHALEPLKAKELGVSGNGTIVFKKGARKESLYVGAEVEKARTQLRSLDAEVQKRLLQVARGRRTVYLTAGHGERTQDPLGGTDQRPTVEVLWKALQDQNFDVRLLSAAEGLGQEVPKDAAAVFVLGPTQPFSGPEAKALTTWAQQGGRVFFALDPEVGLPFDELLGPLGLTFTAQPLAQERGTATLRPPPSLADRVNISTRSFSSHPAATYLSRANAVVLFVGAGSLEEATQHASDLAIDFVVRSLPETWNDANLNFEFDAKENETRKAWGLLAAVTRRAPSSKPADEMRVLVLADSDGIADTVLPQLAGNQYLLLDGFKWLLGDEQLAGPTNTELDVPLNRSRQQDSLWFYGTTFLAPFAVIGVGFFARRRTKPRALPPKEAHP